MTAFSTQRDANAAPRVLLTFVFDVTHLTEEERDIFEMTVAVQTDGKDAGYPDVRLVSATTTKEEELTKS